MTLCLAPLDRVGGRAAAEHPYYQSVCVTKNLSMANICSTTLSIQKDDTCKEPALTDKQAEALRADIEERVVYDGCNFEYDDGGLIECSIGTRWAIPVDALREIAKKHDVKIRAVGREDGAGFVEVACIDAQGGIVQHESINFAF